MHVYSLSECCFQATHCTDIQADGLFPSQLVMWYCDNTLDFPLQIPSEASQVEISWDPYQLECLSMWAAGCNPSRMLLLPCSLCDSSPGCSSPVSDWRGLTSAPPISQRQQSLRTHEIRCELGRALWMASGSLSCLSGDYPLGWIGLYLTLCRKQQRSKTLL